MAVRTDPAAWGASRGLDRFICSAAMNDPEIPQLLAQFQAAHLARRFGLPVSTAVHLADAFERLAAEVDEIIEGLRAAKDGAP